MRNSMRNKSHICHRVQNQKKQAIKSRSKITRTVLKQDEHRKDSLPSTSVISQNSQSTGLVYDERMLKHKHEWFIEEQESPHRIQQAFHRCIEENLVSRCIQVPACPISEDDLTLVHDKSYVEKIKQSCHMSNRELYSLSAEYDGVFFNRYTWLCATLAAGSVKHLTELVVTNQLSNGLALIRPPGHHAMRSEACGYCIFNNIAITAASLLQSKKSITKHNFTYLQRILIIDWDVHHGQGTQYAFYDDNRVLYISIHRYEKAKFWPNLREANYDFIGENLGKGYNVNIPLEETGMTDSDYLAIFYRLIMPIATEFNPQLILISCGFDAAIGCPEGRMWLTPMVFGHFVHKLKSLAGGKVVVILEGGYFVDSLAEGIVHVLKALLDDPLSPIRLIQPPCSSVKDTIESCITVLSPYWKSLLNSSQPISTESLEHLPTITWPLVKVITWPETNPQLPRILTNYIQYLLNNHFPAPLSRSNELIQPMTLILMSTSQLSKLFDLQYGSTNVNGRRKRKQQKFSPESLIPKLNDQFHIHFYNQSSSETTTHNIDPIDQLCFTPRMISPSIGYEWFIQHQQTKCNCPSFAINLKGQMVKNIKDSKKKYEQGNSLKTFQTTIIHALSLILMGQFQTLYFINNSFSLVEFIETITNIPMEFLIEYRKRIFRPRGFQMNTSNDRTIQLMRNISFLNNNNNNNTLNGDKILEKLTHIYFYSNQSSSFTMPLTSISSSSLSSPSLLSSTSQIRSNQLPLKINQDSFNRPCRIIVLDLNGIQKIDEKKFNQFHGFNYEINKKMKCDLVYCSIYYGKLASQLLTEPNQLRAKDLYHTYDPESNHQNKIDNIVWLKIPLPTDNINDEAIDCTDQKLRSQIMNDDDHDTMMIDLLFILYYIFLPIIYEYEPDLIYLWNGSNYQMKNESISSDILARIIYLLNGLGKPVLINGSSINELSSISFIQSLQGKPISIGFNELIQTSPSSKMKHIIQLIIQQNHQRWKCLGQF